jgi:importin-5
MLRRALVADYSETLKHNSTIPSVADATKDEGVKRIWSFLSAETKNTVKTELLNALQQEQQYAIRTKLNDTIADLAAIIVKLGEWPDLLEQLHKFTTSSVSAHRDSALSIFGQLVLLMNKQMEPYFNDIRNLIEMGLKDVAEYHVRLSSMQAVSGFISHGLKGPMKRNFQMLIPLVFAFLQECLEAKRNEATKVLQTMMEWAEADASFYDNHINVIVDGCLGLAGNPAVNEDVRQTSLEFLVTLTEKKCEMVKAVPNFVDRMFTVMIGMLLELEDMDLAEWNEEDEMEESLEYTNSDIAEHAIDRFCKRINMKNLFSSVLRNRIFTMINTGNDWKHRYVGLQLIALIGEGCGRQMKQYLNDIVGCLLPRLADPHPRVRWAACNCAGQLAIDFPPHFQDKYHQHILPSILTILSDVENPKIQSHGAAAITTFCGKYGAANDDNEAKLEEYLHPYMNEILLKLYHMLSSSNRFAVEEAVTCIASLATVASDSFKQYYDHFMPTLKTILGTVLRNPQHAVLRSKCVECISLIGVAVGAERFMPDARDFLDLLTQNFQYFADDSNREFLMQASTRVCKCLREHFVPYLEIFMPFLLKYAGMTKNDFMTYQIHDGSDIQEEAGWDFYIVRDKKVGIHQAAIDEKLSACTQIHLYVEYLGDLLFANWMEPIAKTLVPLMTFAFHKSVRATAIATVPLLLNSTKKYCIKNNQPISLFNGLFEYCWKELVEALKEETLYDIQSIAIEALHECIDICPEGTLPLDYARDAMELLPATLMAIDETIKAREERRAIGDNDETDELEFAEEEQHEHDVTVEFVEVICSLMKHHKPQFMQIFPQYLPLVTQLVTEPKRRDAERQLGFCIFDDLVEWTGDAAHSLGAHIIPLMMQHIQSTHFGIRQACGYGLGLWSQHAPAILAPFASQALNAIGSVITEEARDDDDLVNPTENCISAFGRVIKNMGAQLPVEQVKQGIEFWVNQLPLVSDTVEAPVCHTLLVDFIQAYVAISDLILSFSYRLHMMCIANRKNTYAIR